MTQATDDTFASRRTEDVRLIAGVSAAHFVSHYYILVLPPLFAFVRADYGVSYTEIGLALTAFNGVSAILQTPAGFLIDRFNARLILAAGLIMGAAGLAVSASVDSFWIMVLMFGLMGIGNTVYHPADYALLSRHVASERMSQAFSIHTFAGLLGGAVAPGSLLFMHSLYGWRGAFFGAAILGFVVAAIVLLMRDPPAGPGNAAPRPSQVAPAAGSATPAADGWRVLLITPILINFVFFMLMALTNFGIQNFSVVALGALHGTPAVTANTALTAFLTLGAIGVLAGGWIAGRTARHGTVAMVGMATVSSACLLMAAVDLPAALLILALSIAGFAGGTVLPSRDMIVRAVTPPGAYGKVFGFVTNGFNIAGIVSPLICGALMDHGEPRLVFLSLASFALLAVLTIACVPKQKAG
jgi:MFS transporter, FSR family, fosmidomycin resistance protein